MGYKVFILYFDIIKFREIEQVCGSRAAEKIINLVREKLENKIPFEENVNILRVSNIWGDDFIVVGACSSNCDIRKLQEIALTSRVKILDMINSDVREISGQEIELHVGYSVMSYSDSFNMGSKLYAAIRDAQNVAKGKVDLSVAEVFPEFKEIVEKEQLNVVYQPLVSLSSGRILGWESLVRGPDNSAYRSPAVLFKFAEQTDMLYAIEKVCRKKAIKDFGELGPGQKIFVNIHPRTISDPNFVSGETLNLIKESEFQPENIVFEITERHHIKDYALFNETLYHYRKQGYLVAIDDMGAGFSSLQSLAEIKPDYIKIDMSLVRDINNDRVKKSLIETFTAFAEKIDCQVIAEGIETAEELETLASIGVHYGQGFYLARPSFPKPYMKGNVINEILTIKYEQTWGYSLKVKDIAEAASKCEKNMPVKKVKELFDVYEPINGLVIVEDNRPAGLLMYHNLNQLLGSQYGIPLYFDRPVSEVMDRMPLIIDENTTVEQISQVAMNRERKKLYDSIIITRDGNLAGVVSVQRLLDTLTKMQLEMARGTNPLTGFPGNIAIEQKFYYLSRRGFNFAIVYVDLDNFKAYNDRYGFEDGDQVILFTARLLKSIFKKYVSQGFIGHVGGDDFILMLDEDNADYICEKIKRCFDRLIPGYYNIEDRTNNAYKGYNRHGDETWYSIMSISMAIIDCSNSKYKDFKVVSQKAFELKYYAKSIDRSVYVRDRRISR